MIHIKNVLSSPLTRCKKKPLNQNIIVSSILILATLLWYLPWLTPITSGIIVHDTMDGEIPLNILFGNWIKDQHPWTAALNGNVPIWTYSRLTQPLSLLYAILPPSAAYLCTDILVRGIAFVGIFLIGREVGAKPLTSTLIALCFALSITYTIHLLSIAGIPLLTWLILSAPKASNRKTIGYAAIAIFIGSNTALALSGIFFGILALPIVRFGFGKKIQKSMLYMMLAYGTGLLIGNIGLIYAQFLSGIIWHRVEFEKILPSDNLTALKLATISLFRDGAWYHVSSSQPIFWAGLILALIGAKSEKIKVFNFLAAITAFICIWVIFKTPAGAAAAEHVPLVNQLQIDRFYFLFSILIAYAWLIIASSGGFRKHLILVVILTTQIGLTIYSSPGWTKARSELLEATPSPLISTFNEYYRTKWFDEHKKTIGNSAVMSVGLDPMISLANGLTTIDGYFSLYPLSYKKEFRQIIDSSLPAARSDYFDKWGSRIYAFHVTPETIDFCAAHRLGARFIISTKPIKISTLSLASKTIERPLLYKINNKKCLD